MLSRKKDQSLETLSQTGTRKSYLSHWIPGGARGERESVYIRLVSTTTHNTFSYVHLSGSVTHNLSLSLALALFVFVTYIPLRQVSIHHGRFTKHRVHRCDGGRVPFLYSGKPCKRRGFGVCRVKGTKAAVLLAILGKGVVECLDTAHIPLPDVAPLRDRGFRVLDHILRAVHRCDGEVYLWWRGEGEGGGGGGGGGDKIR